MYNILFYGDSNTWGFDPETCGRYAYEERWTTICAQLLGPEYCCIPAGLNGRTTIFDDPLKGCRNGVHQDVSTCFWFAQKHPKLIFPARLQLMYIVKSV